MNKKQKRLLIVSTVLFLIVTLNPLLFKVSSHSLLHHETWPIFKECRSCRVYFTRQPIYHYWGVIVVPTAVLFFIFKEKGEEK